MEDWFSLDGWQRESAREYRLELPGFPTYSINNISRPSMEDKWVVSADGRGLPGGIHRSAEAAAKVAWKHFEAIRGPHPNPDHNKKAKAMASTKVNPQPIWNGLNQGQRQQVLQGAGYQRNFKSNAGKGWNALAKATQTKVRRFFKNNPSWDHSVDEWEQERSGQGFSGGGSEFYPMDEHAEWSEEYAGRGQSNPRSKRHFTRGTGGRGTGKRHGQDKESRVRYAHYDASQIWNYLSTVERQKLLDMAGYKPTKKGRYSNQYVKWSKLSQKAKGKIQAAYSGDFAFPFKERDDYGKGGGYYHRNPAGEAQVAGRVAHDKSTIPSRHGDPTATEVENFAVAYGRKKGYEGSELYDFTANFQDGFWNRFQTSRGINPPRRNPMIIQDGTRIVQTPAPGTPIEQFQMYEDPGIMTSDRPTAVVPTGRFDIIHNPGRGGRAAVGPPIGPARGRTTRSTAYSEEEMYHSDDWRENPGYEGPIPLSREDRPVFWLDEMGASQHPAHPAHRRRMDIPPAGSAGYESSTPTADWPDHVRAPNPRGAGSLGPSYPHGSGGGRFMGRIDAAAPKTGTVAYRSGWTHGWYWARPDAWGEVYADPKQWESEARGLASEIELTGKARTDFVRGWKVGMKKGGLTPPKKTPAKKKPAKKPASKKTPKGRSIGAKKNPMACDNCGKNLRKLNPQYVDGLGSRKVTVYRCSNKGGCKKEFRQTRK